MSEQQYILYEKKGAIVTITMNRPEVDNALTMAGREQDYAQLMNSFVQAADDDEVKVVILKGSGNAFCVGQDLSRVSDIYRWKTGKEDSRRPSQRIRLKVDRQGNEGVRDIFLHPKFTIAQVHGKCLHGGMYLALACDFTFVADNTKMGFREQWWGYAGQVPVIPLVIMSAGLKRAIDILTTGRLFTGAEAAEWGLVTKSVPADKLEKEVAVFAHQLSLHAADAIAVGKALRHQIYDSMGLLSGFIHAYPCHTLSTALRYDPGEYNFFKEVRDKGQDAAKAGLDKILDM